MSFETIERNYVSGAPRAFNVGLVNATITNSNDSIKITGATSTLSSTNVASFQVGHQGNFGRISSLFLSSDVAIKLTGAHWGAGTLGDLTNAILNVYAINDNGTLKFGVGYLANRDTIVNTSAFTTAASVTASNHLLVNSALTAGTWPCIQIGYFYANFDDTGGAAEDLWTVSSVVGGKIVGDVPNGIYQDFNTTISGFSANPTFSALKWTQIGKMITAVGIKNANGTSNAIGFSVTGPVLAQAAVDGFCTTVTDNSVDLANFSRCQSTASSKTINIFRNALSANFVNTNNKGASFNITYPALY